MPKWEEDTLNLIRNQFLRIPMQIGRGVEYTESAAAWTERKRSQHIAHMKMDPPQVLRMIDCKSTLEQQKVVVVDWLDECYNGMPYTAVSHTYGMEVYEVFDCACASKFIGMRQTSKPRSKEPMCPGHTSGEDNSYVRVVQDILGMCRVLWEMAETGYVWHDGVCIAQHDPDELEETIKHIGWIYSTARDTVIFLHYVGTPMPPISSNPRRPASRWHTRVWTIQEAALSQRRRYCIRMGSSAIFQCKSFEDLERELVAWEEEGSSQVMVVEEAKFMILIYQFMELLGRLMDDFLSKSQGMQLPVLAEEWLMCIVRIKSRLDNTCTFFPTLESTLRLCSGSDSKHMGDRINSIAALAGLKNFAVPKEDKDFKQSTIKFFESLGQAGLAAALFVGNMEQSRQERQSWKHSWLPDLSMGIHSVGGRRPDDYLRLPELRTEEGSRVMDMARLSDLVGIRLKVLDSEKLELTGLWGLIEVQYNWFRKHNKGPLCPHCTSSVGDRVLSMDVREKEHPYYAAFIQGCNTPGERLGTMVTSRGLEEPFQTSWLAFPADKIIHRERLLADATLLEQKAYLFLGPRAILIIPTQEANEYQCIGRFFISPILRKMLATSLEDIVMLYRRLVIV